MSTSMPHPIGPTPDRDESDASVNPREPEFVPGMYRVEFERVGQNRAVTPLETEAATGPDLAEAIYAVARKHCGSRELDVDVCFNGTGFISAGFRNAGDFKWERLAEVAS